MRFLTMLSFICIFNGFCCCDKGGNYFDLGILGLLGSFYRDSVEFCLSFLNEFLFLFIYFYLYLFKIGDSSCCFI